MKELFTLLFVAALPIASLGHKGHTAVFHVSNNGGKLILKAKYELSDLYRVMGEDQCSTEDRVAFCASEYTKDHFHLVLNETFVPLHMESSTVKEGYLILYMTTDVMPNSANSISVTNTCFASLDKHYHNNLVLEWNGETTRYMLDKDRPTINHHLQ